MSSMKNLLKGIATRVFERYELQRIYRLDLCHVDSPRPPADYMLRRISHSDVESCGVNRIRERAGYGGDDAYGFAVFEGKTIVCMTWFWGAKRFRPDHLC